VTFWTMRSSVVCILLISASAVSASEREDRVEIERVISTLNASQATATERARLFTKDAQNELDRLASLDRQMVQGADQPWSEVTTPHMVIQSIRFVTPDVALVDAVNAQYGSVNLVVKVPVLFVMKKETHGWRIAALRILMNSKELR
jgi:hypothetical protein